VIAARLLFFVTINAVLLFYVLLHGSQLALLLISLVHGWGSRRGVPMPSSDLLFASNVIPPVTLLAPAHNEQTTIVDSVHSLLALQYPKLEVIVINDGSADSTMAVMQKAFALRKADLLPYSNIPNEPISAVYISTGDPRLLVIDKVRGGKSDALNAGLNFSRTPWVCSVDADSVLEPDALLRAMRPALDDNTVVVSSGIVRIANGCRIAGGRVLSVGLPAQKLARFQVIEYLQDFLTGRIGWSS
jgi:cellulose synthase/poly-beta-1,6-N-acetylglucosamine synthase-like glycosyltransferase